MAVVAPPHRALFAEAQEVVVHGDCEAGSCSGPATQLLRLEAGRQLSRAVPFQD